MPEILNIPALSVITSLVVLFASWKFQQFDPSHHFFTSKINNFLQLLSSKLNTHIRLYVYVLCALWGFGALGFQLINFQGDNFVKEMIRIYGFSALFLLFLTLTPGLIRVYFPHFILDSIMIKSRRALGLSTFTFALAHGVWAFIFYFSADLNNVSKVSPSYQVAFYFAAAALFIFFLLAASSFDKVVELLSFKGWKILHRLVYLAFLLSVLHTFIRGTHLSLPYQTIALGMVYLTLTFILLEIMATVIYVITNYSSKFKASLVFALLIAIGLSTFYLSFLKLSQLY